MPTTAEIVKELLNWPDYAVRLLLIAFLPFKAVQIYTATLKHQLQYYHITKLLKIESLDNAILEL